MTAARPGVDGHLDRPTEQSRPPQSRPTQSPPPRPGSPRPGALRAGALRPALAVASLAAGFALLFASQRWRTLETSVAGYAIRLTSSDVRAVPAAHLLLVGGPHPIALLLTTECSSVFLLGALALISSPLFLIHRLPIARLLLALVGAAAILVLTNLVRLSVLAATIRGWGVARGLEISHTYLGTFLTLLGTFLAGLTFAAALVLRRRTGPGR